MIAPGLLRRRDAVAAAAREAMTLVFVGALWLVVAGTIEGFISPSESIPWWGKLLVGLGSGALMWGYFLFTGRVTPSAPATPT